MSPGPREICKKARNPGYKEGIEGFDGTHKRRRQAKGRKLMYGLTKSVEQPYAALCR